MTERTSRRGGPVLLALVPILALVAYTLAGPILSGDLWWHLRTGEWILDHRKLPDTDPFSHTAGETHWVLQEYGSQILFGLVHRVAGFTGLRVFGAALGLALLFVVWSYASKRTTAAWAGFLTASFAVLFALKWELRPHLISALLFFALQAVLFRRPVPGPREYLGAALLGCLWVQMHAEALFVPLFGIACLGGALVARLLGQPEGGKRLVSRTVLALAGLLGTLVSPLFLEPHRYAIVGRSVPKQWIEEWFRPWVLPGDPRFAPLSVGVFAVFVVFLAIGSGFTLARSAALLRRRGAAEEGPSWERIAFLAACLFFALQARRFFWLAWFPVAELVFFATLRNYAVRTSRLLPVAGTLGAAAVLAVSHYPSATMATREYSKAVADSLFPVKASDFVREAGLEGNLFHPYEWGGFLGWETRNPVYVDGRTVLFEEVIPERWTMERWRPLEAGEFTSETLSRRDVRVVVSRKFGHETFALPWTPPNPTRWLRVWTDALATVWIRRDDVANVERAGEHLAAMGIDFDPREGFLEAAALEAYPEWTGARWFLARPVASRLVEANEQAADPLADAAAWVELGMRKNARHVMRKRVLGLAGLNATERREWLIEIGADDLAPVIDSLRGRLLEEAAP